MKALVIGAGPAGTVLAAYLARRGYEVDVFERRPATVEHGAKRASVNITLCERGLQALAAVGLRDAVLSHTSPVLGRRVHSLDGSLAYQPYGSAGEAIHSISRSTLSDVLIESVGARKGIRFHFDQKCTHVDLAAPSARFQEVRTGATSDVRADVLFGADGAYSTVRLQMQKSDRFDFSQKYWSQGYTSIDVPPGPDGKPALEAGAIHVWPRGECMLIAFPNRDGRLACSLLLPFEGSVSYESLTTAERLMSLFAELFSDAVDFIPRLAEQFFAGPRNSLLTIRCKPWSVGAKALLIGDAAHAILPSYGQGANAAFEDCRLLDACLTRNDDDWASAFREFEGIRKPSLDTMADLCVEHFTELSELVADPIFLKRREIERRMHALHPDLYQSLYSMVTFTTMPYLDAVRIDRNLRRLVDRVMGMENPETLIERPELREMLIQSVGGGLRSADE